MESTSVCIDKVQCRNFVQVENNLTDHQCTPVKKGKKNKAFGKLGEDMAAAYLKRYGYEILERNWTCPAGEADLIICDDSALIFVEVKTRHGYEKGMPEEAITPQKRKRYEGIACFYLHNHSFPDMRIRFDVVGVVVDGDHAVIKHHLNAYGCM